MSFFSRGTKVLKPWYGAIVRVDATLSDLCFPSSAEANFELDDATPIADDILYMLASCSACWTVEDE